ncbi:MAG TPA: hypothetical protein VFH51_17130 [Myxococcota bacterium]|nr:hypothetical protein [Myxococcota bacterium]
MRSRSPLSVLGLALMFTFILTPACQVKPTPENVAAAQALQTTKDSLGVSDLGLAFGHLACARLFSCCPTAEIGLRLGDSSVSDPAACERLLDRRYGLYMDRVAQSHIRGRLVYRGDRARRCVESLREATCDAYILQGFLGPTPGSDCDAWREPRVENGGACADDHECKSGHCAGIALAPGGALEDGTCAPLPALGAPCESACVKGASCDSDQDPAVCVPARGAGAACEADAQCQSGICERDVAGVAGTCVAAPTSCRGEP